MASCEKCGRKIPEGEKYCVSCKETKTQKRRFWEKIGAGVALVIGVIATVLGRGNGGGKA